MFLGQEPGLSRLDLVDRSLALDVLVDYFFLEWSKSRGRMIARADQCSLVALGNFVSLYCTAALSFTLFSPLSTFLSLLSPHYCLHQCLWCFFPPLYFLLRSPSLSMYLFPCSGWLVNCKVVRVVAQVSKIMPFPALGLPLATSGMSRIYFWLSSVLPFLIFLPLDLSLWCICCLFSSV